MNIKNLKEYIQANGNEFKSYRHLCEVLGVRPKEGNSRPTQRKEIKRYCNLEKGDGNRWNVNEIYKTPKPAKGNNIYGGLVQLLLTDYFMKTKKDNIQHSKGYLMQQVNMINKNYRENKKNIQKYSLQLEIEQEVTHDFYDTTDATLGSAIETALKNLENNALILYTTDYIVKPVKSNKYRVANPMERSVILRTRDKLLKELGYKTIRDALFSKDQKVYKDRTNEILKEEINIERVFKGYDIDILQESIAEKQSQMIIKHLSEVESKGYKDELNSLVVNRLLENALKRHKDVLKLRAQKTKQLKESIAFGDINKMGILTRRQKARESDNYIKAIEKMINENINNEYIENEVKKLVLDDEASQAINNIFN